MPTDPETGEILDASHGTDQYGRPWGTVIWPGGPTLGGRDWRAWLESRRDVAPLPRLHGRRA